MSLILYDKNTPIKNKYQTTGKFLPVVLLIGTLFMIGWNDWYKKRVNYLSYIEGKEVLKDIWYIKLNDALFISLL